MMTTMDTRIDARRKLNDATLNEIREMLKHGHKPETVASTFSLSSVHVYRIQAALRNGSINLKPTSLYSCTEHIKNGLPFKRISWPEKLYYYCAVDEPQKWFVKVNKETGNELITYQLELSLEDLLAKDWIMMTWESVE